jgi:hypothetical protein
MGFVYMRSDWDSPDATWISFWAGPHIDTHQHREVSARVRSSLELTYAREE